MTCGKLGVQRLDQIDGVLGTVEKIGVAEGDVGGAGGDLRANIGEHRFALDDSELAVVNRHDGTMPAEMLAAAARLGISDQPRAIALTQFGIAGEIGKAGAVGREKLAAGPAKCVRLRIAVHKIAQSLLKLAAQNRFDAEGA